MSETNSIFRKKSLDRISTPEDLDNYLSVTGPGIWLPLLAVVALLIGALVWMALGQLDTTLNVAVTSENGAILCYVPAERMDAVREGDCVTIAGKSYPLRDAGYSARLISGETDGDIRLAGSLAEGTTVQPLQAEGELPDGVYQGEIVVETVNPIKFIIN